MVNWLNNGMAVIVVGVEGPLVQDVPRDVDRLDPFSAVGVCGQVVEPERRVDPWVSEPDLHRAPASEYIGPMWTW